MAKETLEAMEACEPQANLYMAAEEYAEEKAYDFKGFSDDEDYKELAELMKQAVVYGAHWKEQQMMKDAVPGRISVNRFGNKVVSSRPGIQQLQLLHTYDKVKLIIIKED